MQLQRLVRLREAQTRIAAEDLRIARMECDAAAEAKDIRLAERDVAGATWLRLLGETRPQPGLVGLGSGWLLEQERRLEVEELNLSIARSRFQKSAEAHAEALACEAAIRKTGVKARKTMEKCLEERQSSRLSDSLLWRRRR